MKKFLKIILIAISIPTFYLYSMDDILLFNNIESLGGYDGSHYGSSYPPPSFSMFHHPGHHKLSDSTPQISYSLATKKDKDQILLLMKNIEEDEDDSKLLVIIPEPLRSDHIDISISKKRLFVAKSDGIIISMLTLFVIDSTIMYNKASSTYESELSKILISELRCCDGVPGCMYPLQSYRQHVKIMMQNKPLPIIECKKLGCKECEIQFDPNEKKCFIYYGSAYVSRYYRKNGIATNLLEYAFKKILSDFTDQIQIGTEIVLAYGQAEANKNHRFMLRTFANMITSIRVKKELSGLNYYHLRHEIFKSYVPAFDSYGNRLPDTDDREGVGNLVIYKLCE